MRFEYEDLEGTCAISSQRPPPFKKPPPRTGMPIRVVLDLTTLLEGFTGTLAIIAFSLSLFCCILAWGDHGADAQREWALAMVCGTVFAVTFFIWRSTDCYYVMDGRQKKLLYHFEFLGIIRENPIATFPEITGLALDAWERYTKPKNRSGYYYWVYATVIVLRDGERLVVSNETRDPDLISGDARKAAEVVGCPFEREGQSTPYRLFSLW